MIFTFWGRCWPVLPLAVSSLWVPREHFTRLQLKCCLYMAIDFLYQELPIQWNQLYLSSKSTLSSSRWPAAGGMTMLAIYCRVSITWNLLKTQILCLTLCLLEIWEFENHWSNLICQNLPLSFFFLLHISISLFTPVIFSQSWILFLNVFESSCGWGSP